MDNGVLPNAPLQPVTKVLAASSIALAIAIQMGFLSLARVVFSPAKIVSQPWRLYTSFCYFGNLNIGLVQRIFMLSQTSETLERAYVMKLHNLPPRLTRGVDVAALQQRFDDNRPWDFSYFLFRIAISIVACLLIAYQWYDLVKHYLVLGPTLKSVLLYIVCRNGPEDFMMFLGIRIRAKYAPFIETAMSMIFSTEFQTLLRVRSDFVTAVCVFARSEVVAHTLFEFLTGHIWWFVEFVYLSRTETQASWERACTEMAPDSLMAELDPVNIIRWIITPPWYFWITMNMRAENAVSRGNGSNSEQTLEVNYEGDIRDLPWQSAERGAGSLQGEVSIHGPPNGMIRDGSEEYAGAE